MSVINEREEFVGGAIMPGLRLSLEALSSRASLLPHIDLIPPKNVIGRNTIDAMDSGMIYGTASMLDGMIDRIQEELGTAGAGHRHRRTVAEGHSLLQAYHHPGPELVAEGPADFVL